MYQWSRGELHTYRSILARPPMERSAAASPNMPGEWSGLTGPKILEVWGELGGAMSHSGDHHHAESETSPRFRMRTRLFPLALILAVAAGPVVVASAAAASRAVGARAGSEISTRAREPRPAPAGLVLSPAQAFIGVGGHQAYAATADGKAVAGNPKFSITFTLSG